MRPRKAKFLTQDHTAGKSQRQDLNKKKKKKKILAPESVLLTPTPCCLLFSVCKERRHVIIRKVLTATEWTPSVVLQILSQTCTFSLNFSPPSKLPPSPSVKPRPWLEPFYLKPLLQLLSLSSQSLCLPEGPAPITLRQHSESLQYFYHIRVQLGFVFFSELPWIP